MRLSGQVFAVLCALTLGGRMVIAQQPAATTQAPAPTPAPPAPLPSAQEQLERRQADARAREIASLNDKTPLQTQVVVSRYQGEKRISSMPYVLTVNAVGAATTLPAAEWSRIRMGAKVPMPMRSLIAPKTTDGANKADALPTTSVTSYTLEDIGTAIDSRARSMGDGRFEVSVSIEEKSIYTAAQDSKSPLDEVPVIRSFQANQVLILRDGQSRQFTAATDRVSGEVVRIDVTLTVLK